MPRLNIRVPGERRDRSYDPSDQQIRIGAATRCEILLTDPGWDGPERRIPGHIATIYIVGQQVNAYHVEKKSRDHGLWVVPAGRSPQEVAYGSSVPLRGDGMLVIRDSPNVTRVREGERYDLITIPYRAVGVETPGMGRPGDQVGPEDIRDTGLIDPIPERTITLTDAERDVVTAFALPWITKRPELWLTKKLIEEMWDLRGHHSVLDTMNRVRQKMEDCDPPLWEPVRGDRPGRDEAAAAILALNGVVTMEHVTYLNLVNHVLHGAEARRYHRRDKGGQDDDPTLT